MPPEAEAAAEAAEELDVGAAGAAETNDAPEQTEAAEDKALRMGWVPKDQFKGDPEKWTDAATFIKRGDEFLPFLKANNRKLEQANTKLGKELAELRSTLDEFREHHSKTATREYERAMRDLQAQQDEAVQAGDVEAVRATTKEITELAAEIAKPAKVAEAEPEKPKGPPDDWLDENRWYKTDRVMRAAAIEIAQEIADEGGGPAAQLKEVAKRIREEFPHKFRNPRRDEPAAVEGGGARGGKGAKGYSDLPPEAKTACDRFVRQGLLTKEKYVKEFFGANA